MADMKDKDRPNQSKNGEGNNNGHNHGNGNNGHHGDGDSGNHYGHGSKPGVSHALYSTYED